MKKILVICLIISVNLFAIGLNSEQIKAIEVLKEHCNKRGKIEGCYKLGQFYSLNQESIDKEKAIEFLNKACNGGLVASCKILESKYPNSIDTSIKVEINYDEHKNYIDNNPMTYTMDDDTYNDEITHKRLDKKTNKPVTYNFDIFYEGEKKIIASKVKYVNGYAVSYHEYYKNGKISEQWEKDKGSKYYFASGNLKAETYKENKNEITNVYFSNGNLEYTVTKYNDIKVKIRTSYFESGEIGDIYQFNKENKLSGICKEFYKNGNIMRYMVFKNGEIIDGYNNTEDNKRINFTRAHINNINLKYKNIRYKCYSCI